MALDETGWYDVAAEPDDSVLKDTELDGPENHIDIVEGPDCVLASDPDDPGADETDATDTEEVSEDTGPGGLDEVAGVAKTGRDDAEIEEAELRNTVVEDTRSDETAYEEGGAEEAVSDEVIFEGVPSTFDEVAAGRPRLSDSAPALVSWLLCDISTTRVVPLDVDAGTRIVCELESRIVSVVDMLPLTTLLLLGAKFDCVGSLLPKLLGLAFPGCTVDNVEVGETLILKLLVPASTFSRAEGVDKTAPVEVLGRFLSDCTLRELAELTCTVELETELLVPTLSL
ncbi:hypothetical protein E4U58_005922 [Claviceps cyperi]|nr:hypothetical protein E4U58_005922 [Claviceps cyperi]